MIDDVEVSSRPEGSSQQRVLTVGIPTWNRRGFVVRLVRLLGEQLESETGRGAVEIVVCDNASTDGTGDAVRELAQQGAMPLRYFRQPENLGAIRNVLSTLEHACGRYWTFLGDDDRYAEGALGGIAALLEDSDAPVVHFVDDTPRTDAATGRVGIADAASYLYAIGNAGRFAVRSDLARSAVAMRGVSEFRTCWPQTEIAFLAMALSGDSAPLLVARVPSAVSDDHGANTTYTSYYLAKTALIDLQRVAVSVRHECGEEFYRRAESMVFTGARFNELFNATVLYGVYDDERVDRANCRKALWTAARESEGLARRRFRMLALLQSLPRSVTLALWWGAMALRHSPGKA
ncbi:MAG: glycosyltransferase family 2 protein, partial [Actinobacteria bacterium]